MKLDSKDVKAIDGTCLDLRLAAAAMLSASAAHLDGTDPEARQFHTSPKFATLEAKLVNMVPPMMAELRAWQALRGIVVEAIELGQPLTCEEAIADLSDLLCEDVDTLRELQKYGPPAMAFGSLCLEGVSMVINHLIELEMAHQVVLEMAVLAGIDPALIEAKDDEAMRRTYIFSLRTTGLDVDDNTSLDDLVAYSKNAIAAKESRERVNVNGHGLPAAIAQALSGAGVDLGKLHIVSLGQDGQGGNVNGVDIDVREFADLSGEGHGGLRGALFAASSRDGIAGGTPASR